MKSNMMQKRASRKVALTDVSDETIQQGIQIANELATGLALDDPRLDAIAEIEARLQAVAQGGENSDADGASVLEDIQQLAQFRRAIRGQRPETEPKVEASGSDNFAMNNEHPESVERHASEEKEAGTQGSNGFVTDRDDNGEPKAPERLEVPRVATETKRHDDVPVAQEPNVFQGGDGTKAEDKKASMTTKKAAPPAPAPAPAAGNNIFNSWTSDCLAAAIKAVTSTAEYASDKAAQSGVGMMNDALKNRPAMPEQVMASKKKDAGQSGGFAINDGETGNIIEGGKAQGPGDKAIPSSRAEEELSGLDHSGKITKPENVVTPSKFAGAKGVERLMASLKLAASE